MRRSEVFYTLPGVPALMVQPGVLPARETTLSLGWQSASPETVRPDDPVPVLVVLNQNVVATGERSDPNWNPLSPSKPPRFETVA